MENSKWTIETYAAHNEALRKAEDKFQKERDRRYKELQAERDKTEVVKEKAHSEALILAREIQTYKTERQNELIYARKEEIKSLESKFELLLKPIVGYIEGSKGSVKGMEKTFSYIIAIGGILVGLLIAFLKFN